MDIHELLALAKRGTDASSERGLARALRIDNNMLTHYRRGISLPSDATMVRICDAAGISRVEGLLHLNMWRSDGEVRRAYGDLLKILKRAAGPAPRQNAA